MPSSILYEAPSEQKYISQGYLRIKDSIIFLSPRVRAYDSHTLPLYYYSILFYYIILYYLHYYA